MYILSVPNIKKKELEDIQWKLNNTTARIVIFPFDCHLIEIPDKTNRDSVSDDTDTNDARALGTNSPGKPKSSKPRWI